MNDGKAAPVDYDPFSHEAMSDPVDLYKAMRAEGCPHWIEGRRAWALTRFDDLRSASLRNAMLDFTHGQTPGQVLLGEPHPHTFMTMNMPESRKWRSLLDPFYTPSAIEAEVPELQMLVQQEFSALRGQDAFDFYNEFTNRVMCIVAGQRIGLTRAESVLCRTLIDDILLDRQPGQVGATSQVNQAAAAKLGAVLSDHVAVMRRDPSRAGSHGRVLMDAEVDGVRLDDQALLGYLFSLLVVGSETTPMATAGTLYYLAQHPEQKAAVLAEPALARAAFLETCRLDQPTNMLARRARADFELSGCPIKAGDNLLFIYASANRDENRFDRPDEFDIFRSGPKDISFGSGSHFCLGLHLAGVMAELMLKEFLNQITDYEVVESGVERAYGEHLQGFVTMPLRVSWK